MLHWLAPLALFDRLQAPVALGVSGYRAYRAAIEAREEAEAEAEAEGAGSGSRAAEESVLERARRLDKARTRRHRTMGMFVLCLVLACMPVSE